MPDEYTFRISQVEADIKALEDKVTELPVINTRLGLMEKSLVTLDENVKGLNKTLVGFAFAIAGSAIAVLLGITQVVN